MHGYVPQHTTRGTVPYILQFISKPLRLCKNKRLPVHNKYFSNQHSLSFRLNLEKPSI